MGIGEIIIFYILRILWLLLRISFFLILFILFLFLVIILSNIKYQIKTDTKVYDESEYSQDFKFKLTYLFKIIRVYCDKKNDRLRICVKVFKKDVFKTVKFFGQDINFGKNKSKKTPEDDEELKVEPSVYCNNNPDVTKSGNVDIQEDTVKKESKPKKVKNQTPIHDYGETVEEENEHDEQINKNNKKEITFIDTLKNKDIVLKILKATIKVLKRLKPERFSFYLLLGFEDPSVTGQAIGFCYTVRGVTGLDISADGDFTKEINPEITGIMKGKFSIIKLASPYLFLIVLFIKFKLSSIFKKNKGE